MTPPGFELAPYNPPGTPLPDPQAPGTPKAWLWRVVRVSGPAVAPLGILAASYSAHTSGASHSLGDAALAAVLAAGIGTLGVVLRAHKWIAGSCLGAAGAVALLGIGAYTTNTGLRIGYTIVAIAVSASVRAMLGRGEIAGRETRAAQTYAAQLEATTKVTVKQIGADAAIERTRIKESARTEREAIRARTAIALGYDPHASVTAQAWAGITPQRRRLLELAPAAREALAADPGTAALLGAAWGSGVPAPEPDPAGVEMPGNYL